MSEPRLTALPAFEDNYVWLMVDADRDAVVVDPGDAAPVRAALARSGLHLRAILLTHHHADHIGGAAALADDTGAIIVAPVDPRIPSADRRVGAGDRVELDRPAFAFDVIAVPGHTTSHVAFHGHGLLFCGDTLFSVGCGRLFEGTPAQMLDSLDRIARLPATTRICCGHEYTLANCAFARTIEPDNVALARRTTECDALRARGEPTLPSTLADELACNPFLRIDAPALVGALGAGSRTERFAALRERKDAFRAPAR